MRGPLSYFSCDEGDEGFGGFIEIAVAGIEVGFGAFDPLLHHQGIGPCAAAIIEGKEFFCGCRWIDFDSAAVQHPFRCFHGGFYDAGEREGIGRVAGIFRVAEKSGFRNGETRLLGEGIKEGFAREHFDDIRLG